MGNAAGGGAEEPEHWTEAKSDWTDIVIFSVSEQLVSCWNTAISSTAAH